ncbi:MAG TPA: amino acid adenylation domain-containing protein [Prolixibacteraceae bacterium]|nr:amino acid adenylation domain-containing protein [Prolixibacteraceae bacterium]
MEILNKITCIVVGEGNLPLKCMGIMKDHGITIQALVSGDEWLLHENASESFPKYNNLRDLSVFDPVDYIFSINNSLILKKPFTSLARKMAINYHDAPLSRYAGMFATNWAILNGEKEHGVSWHEVVDAIDAGDIVASQRIPILPNDTALSLNTRCFEAALKSFEELIISIVENRLSPVAQNLENRTYFPLGARPDYFGLITHDMNAKPIDALIRATNFSSHYPNEFTLPLLYISNDYYIAAKASVVFDQSGNPGQVIDFNGKRGFYCQAGIVLPEIIYDKNGEKANIESILEIGSQMQLPNQTIAAKAVKQFMSMARFEPFWKKQLAVAEYLAWPVNMGKQSSKVAETKLDEAILNQLAKLFPEQKTEDILSSALLLFFLRLSNQSAGTLGFVSSVLPENIQELEGFFNTWVPLNGAIDDSNPVVNEMGKIITNIKRIKKSETFSRSTRIRYPDLRNNASDKPDIILSKASEESNYLNAESVLINIGQNKLSFSLPVNSNYSGIHTIVESFEMFLQQLIQSPAQTVNQIGLVSAEKAIGITESINQKICEPVMVDDVINRFNAVSAEFPEKTVIFDSGKNYSYSTFDKDVENLSVKMISLGIQSGQIVAVEIGRNYNYFVSIMATLRCGASFLPIDPTMPWERKQFFCTDAGVSLILVDGEVLDLVESIPLLNVSDFEISGDKKWPQTEYSADSVAYIIYTSGSTGIPKGVKISRKALANFISGALGLYEITADDRVLQFSSLAFDASIEEIFTSFCSGAAIYLRTAEMLMADELLSYSQQHQISVWDLPTAFWRQVIQSDVYLNKPLPESLRLVIIGGEAVSTNDIALWNKRETKHRLFNTYGPTETTVVALAYEIKAGYQPKTTVPIGQPLPGYQLYVADTNRQLVPEGIAGELLISGDSLALGYLNREPEQNKAFIDFETPDNGLCRCYRTGDLVTAGSDGLIYYQGRVDAQVKIRGFRVEPGEIEQQICSVDGIETCVVVVSENASGEKSLYAFYLEKGVGTTVQTIKEELKKKLPAYIVPELIFKVDGIPLTSNGKVDKKSLIKTAMETLAQSTNESAKPTNETEELVLSLWQKTLGIESMGIDDDFFDLGGHSLKAVQLMSEIKRLKGINIPLASLISNSTVRSFAPLLTSDKKNDLWQCLVTIRPTGEKTPLFLIHGAGLNVLLYQSLSHHLKEDRPIYAFQAKGLDGSQELSNSLEEMADDYIEEIKKIQPEGPYMLLGFSLGGFIAYDMAKKLVSNGSEVCFTGMIDSVASEAIHIQSPTGRILFKLKTSLIKPFYVSWLLIKEPMAGKRQLLRNKYKSIRFSLMFKLIRLGIIKEKDRKIQIEGNQQMFVADNVEMIMTEALVNYEIKPADIQIDLFRAGKVTFYIPNRKDYGWATFAQKGVVIHTLPDEHSRIFAPPNDKLFAEILDNRLDEIEANMKK